MKSLPTGFRLILTCEHAKNHVPRRFQDILPLGSRLLQSHRGYDSGALEVARAWQRLSHSSLHTGQLTRLLVDLNRSLFRGKLWSKYSLERLTQVDRDWLLEKYYHPYRQAVEEAITKELKAGHRVVHISVHSFVPILAGVKRNAQLGLLYDPKRPLEKALAINLAENLQAGIRGMRVRRNYPYLGTSDGFTVALRRKFPKSSYIGIELELRQDWLGNCSPDILARVLHSGLIDSLGKLA